MKPLQHVWKKKYFFNHESISKFFFELIIFLETLVVKWNAFINSNLYRFQAYKITAMVSQQYQQYSIKPFDLGKPLKKHRLVLLWSGNFVKEPKVVWTLFAIIRVYTGRAKYAPMCFITKNFNVATCRLLYMDKKKNFALYYVIAVLYRTDFKLLRYKLMAQHYDE